MVFINIISEFFDDLSIEYNNKATFEYIAENILQNLEIYDYNDDLINNDNIEVHVLYDDEKT